MNESEWVGLVIQHLEDRLCSEDGAIAVSQGTRLTYASETLSYSGADATDRYEMRYETDILVAEHFGDDLWKPRIVIEAKVGRITTHDAITYSQKAATHKNVHPYLRYGIMIGNRTHYPLPGRLFRHGAYFDFMQSWCGYEPAASELDAIVEVLTDEMQASRNLEEIIYHSRSPKRERYTLLHRPLRLEP